MGRGRVVRWLAAIVIIGPMALPPAGAQEAPGPAEAGVFEARTPTTGLVHGQEIVVQGSGWPAGARLQIFPCAADRTGYLDDRCESFGADVVHLRTGPEGRFRRRVSADVLLELGDPGNADCRVEACELLLMSWSQPIRARIPLQFDPSGPDPSRPPASIDPATGLVDGQVVELTASDIPPPSFGSNRVRIMQCQLPVISAWECDEPLAEAVRADDGTLSTTVTVRTWVHPEDRAAHDCRTGGCVLLIDTNREETSQDAIIPLDFDPAGEAPPAPTLAVEPATGLHDAQVVRLVGTNRAPDTEVFVLQCPIGAPFRHCDEASGADGATDLDGDLDMEIRVQAILTSFNGRVETDCRQVPSAFRVGMSRGATQMLPLELEPGSPLVEPTIRIQPRARLAEQQQVTVRATGLWTDGWIYVLQCTGPFGAQGGIRDQRCTRGREIRVGGGDFAVPFTVRRHIHTWDFGEVDCRARGCRISIWTFGEQVFLSGVLGFRA